MSNNQKGFGAIGILAVVAIIGLIGGVGWTVYDRQKSNTDINKTTITPTTESTDTENTETSTKESDYKTVDGIKYPIPSGWKNAKGPSKDSEMSSGPYLLSPDYREAGGGQLSIEAGAFIHFQALEWAGIDLNTTLEQAVNVVKNSEGAYLDPSSVKTTNVGGREVMIFNAGHTTDGVTVFYKTSGGKWLDIGFSTVTGGDGNYNAQESPHYKIFLSWLVEFVQLNP